MQSDDQAAIESMCEQNGASICDIAKIEINQNFVTENCFFLKKKTDQRVNWYGILCVSR